MMRISHRAWLASLATNAAPTFLLFGVACDEPRSVGIEQSADSLSAGSAARVGDAVVSIETVRRIAEEQNLSPEQARSAAVRDTLMALAAQDRLEKTGLPSAVERSALSRALLQELEREAASVGSPTHEERDAILRDRWHEFDRPTAVRTTHAVARFSDNASPAAVRAIAERIHEAVRGAESPRAFAKQAAGVDAGDIEVRIERLHPVTLDGRVLPVPDLPNRSGSQFDPKFAAGAHQLRAVGDISPPLESPFGYHVIFLEGRLDARSMSDPEVQRSFEQAVMALRAEKSLSTLLELLQSSTVIERSPAAEALTAKVVTTQ